MKKIIKVPVKERIVEVATDIVYMQKKGWCNATNRQLKLSLIRERTCFPYDCYDKHPLLIWICGGGFTSVDEDAWIPEMTYFAKKGYVVACLEYSVEPNTLFPTPEKEIKAAIRYLRAHADDYYIDKEKIAIAGESAGAYLAAFVGLTGDDITYEEGEYRNESSSVKAIITWYSPVKLKIKKSESEWNRPDLCQLVTDKTPPILMLHGTNDCIVPNKQSELLYNAYQKAGNEADLYLIEGADHGAHEFAQDEVKQIMVDFLDKNL